MKNLRYLAVIVFLGTACSEDDPQSPEVKNMVPAIPELTLPADLKLCLESAVTFQWDASVDPQKDAVVYQIQVALDPGFLNIVQTKEAAVTNQVIVLEKNAHYYWRVKATDSKGGSSEYSVGRSFYTAADPKINHLPFAAELLQPVVNPQNTNTATLQWSAVDLDPEDILVYDVYFGTVNPPTVKIAENAVSKMLEVSLEPNKEYFWQVVVKDNHQGQAKGQVWSFKTN